MYNRILEFHIWLTSHRVLILRCTTITVVVWCLSSVDYMQQTGGQAHLFFWMTVEGYRVTAQQQLEVLQSRQKDGKHQTNQTKGLLRAAAFGVYEQYLSEKVGITYFCILWKLFGIYYLYTCFFSSYGYNTMKRIWCSTSCLQVDIKAITYVSSLSLCQALRKCLPLLLSSPFKKAHSGTDFPVKCVLQKLTF